jgi:hypothetical protein
MDARQHRRDRFDNKPELNKRGQPIRAYMVGRQPAILRALAEHNALTVYDLHAIVGGNLRALRDTVRRLKDEPNELIRIIPEQLRTRNLRQNLYYQLAPKGVEWLNANGLHAEQPRRVYNLGHTGLVSHISASIAAGVAQHEDARFISWEEMQTHPKFPKETIKAKDNTAIPHGKEHIRPDTHPFGIELLHDGQKKYRFAVLEADNGTETIKPTKPDQYTGNSIYAKFEAYLDFIENKGFHARYGLPNYFVIFVFTSRARLDNAKALLASMTRHGSRYILFQLVNHEAPHGYIFTTPCERVGHDPLQLNQP